MCPGIRPATGWMANSTSTPRLQPIIQLADLVLRLRYCDSVAGHDDNAAGGFQHRGRFFGAGALDR